MSDAYKAFHPNIPHDHSPLNLGARVTPIRPLLRKIEEKARVTHTGVVGYNHRQVVTYNHLQVVTYNILDPAKK